MIPRMFDQAYASDLPQVIELEAVNKLWDHSMPTLMHIMYKS